MSREQRRTRVKQKLGLLESRAIIGRTDGLIHVAGKKGWIHVRVETSTGYVPDEARCKISISLDPNTGVILRKGKDNKWDVKEVDFEAAVKAGRDPILLSNPLDPRAQAVQQDTVATALAQQTSPASTYFSVLPWIYFVGETIYHFRGGNIQLSTFIPSAGEHCLVLICIKPDQTLAAFGSTTQPTYDPLDLTDAQECWTDAYTDNNRNAPIWYLKLADGQTTITNAAKWADARQLINSYMSEGTVVHDHEDNDGGGQLNASNVFNAGTVPVVRLPVLVGADGTDPGIAGIVPAPLATDNTKYLRGDGTWQSIASGVTDHGALTGLTDDDHSQYLYLTGRGGQTILDKITINYDLATSSSVAVQDIVLIDYSVTPDTDEHVGTWYATAGFRLSGELHLTNNVVYHRTVVFDLVVDGTEDAYSIDGFSTSVTHNSTGTTGFLTGLYYYMPVNYGTVTGHNGITLVFEANNTATVSSATGISLSFSKAAGATTSARKAIRADFTGTISTNDYVLYFDDNVQSYHRGKVGIGPGANSVTPASMLVIGQENTSTQALNIRGAGTSGAGDLIRVQNSGALNLFSLETTGITTITARDTATNAVTNALIIDHASSGTATNGFGTGIQLLGESSTTNSQNIARIVALWNDATHPSRSGDLIFYANYTDTPREGIRIRGGASNVQIGFFEVTPVSRPAALTAADGSAVNSGDATTDTVIANMRTRIGELESKLQSLGLIA